MLKEKEGSYRRNVIVQDVLSYRVRLMKLSEANVLEFLGTHNFGGS